MAGDKNACKGVAIIVVLWIVAIMGMITMMFSQQSRLSLKINRNSGEASKAELAAEAGIHHMMAYLVQEEQETPADTKMEPWFDSQELFSNIILDTELYNVYHPDLESTSGILYGAMDECGKLNINTATKDMLMMLPKAEEEVVEAILDWRDEDDEPREFGAESDYYMGLAEPYLAKNNLFDSIDELFLVKGVTLDMIYGEDYNSNGILDANENDGADNYPLDNSDGTLDRGWFPYITCYSYEKNVDQNGMSRVNINSADEDQLEESLSDSLNGNQIESIVSGRDDEEYESIGDLMSRGPNLNRETMKEVADFITVSDEEQLFGRINVNTTSLTVLQCLFPNTPELAQTLIDYRDSDNGPFNHIGELLDVSGINNNQFSQLASLLCTKSSVFNIRTVGMSEQTKAYKEVMALFDRGAEPPQIIYWKVIR